MPQSTLSSKNLITNFQTCFLCSECPTNFFFFLVFIFFLQWLFAPLIFILLLPVLPHVRAYIFFQLPLPLLRNSMSFPTRHPQHSFGWSISELRLFVCIVLWLKVYGHYQKNSYSVTIPTPSLGRKTSAAFFYFIGLIDGSTTQRRSSSTHHKLFILLGKPYIVERPKSARKKKRLYPPSSVFHG